MTDASPDTLVESLNSAGELPAEFGPLLRKVARERFVPDHIWVGDEAIDRTTESARWRGHVYSDVPIVTQFDDGKTKWPEVGKVPTCSNSMPSVVVGMLHELDVRAGQTVLEIGTGTGWVAALLSEMVGFGRVTTIEIDRALCESARTRLIEQGNKNVLPLNGDGTFGARHYGPYDRIISTASVYLGRVPYSWVEQTKPGGIILTPVRADLTDGPLVRFVVGSDGTATGHLVPMGVAFMDVRSQRSANASVAGLDLRAAEARRTTTEIDPGPMLRDPNSRWAIAVAVPSCRYNTTDGILWLRDPITGSWASVEPSDGETFVVRQDGIRRLWDEAETAYRWWHKMGQPSGLEWEWTVTPDRQTVQLTAPRE